MTPIYLTAARETWSRASAWTGRIAGLDLARAIALIGMFAAHIGDSGTRGPESQGWGWLWVFDGRSSAIFAVLAGVTTALIIARDTVGPAHAGARIAARGVILMAAGYALSALGTPVDVILTNLGLMFVMVVPCMRWRPTALLAGAAAAFTIGALVARRFSGDANGWWVAEKLVSQHYPALAWVGYVLVGMAIGRVGFRDRRAALAVASTGALIAAAAYGAGIASGGAAPWNRARPSAAAVQAWTSVAPHSDTTLEMLGNTGVALAVIGVCVAVVRQWRPLLPLLAFGSMSLTMYSAHLLIIAAVGDPIVWQPSNVALVALTLGLIAAATAWRVGVGAGPLERGLTRVSVAAADAIASRGGHT